MGWILENRKKAIFPARGLFSWPFSGAQRGEWLLQAPPWAMWWRLYALPQTPRPLDRNFSMLFQSMKLCNITCVNSGKTTQYDPECEPPAESSLHSSHAVLGGGWGRSAEVSHKSVNVIAEPPGSEGVRIREEDVSEGHHQFPAHADPWRRGRFNSGGPCHKAQTLFYHVLRREIQHCLLTNEKNHSFFLYCIQSDWRSRYRSSKTWEIAIDHSNLWEINTNIQPLQFINFNRID